MRTICEQQMSRKFFLVSYKPQCELQKFWTCKVNLYTVCLFARTETAALEMLDGGAGGVRCGGRLCENGLEARALAAIELVHVVILIRVGRLGAHVLGGGHRRRAASVRD